MLSGPARVKLYPTPSSQACAQCEYEDSGELIQFGYLEFKMPTGSAVVEVAQIAGSSSGALQRKAARRK